MALVSEQHLGWMPSLNEKCFSLDGSAEESAPNAPLLPFMSSSTSQQIDSNNHLSRVNSTRRQHEPGWVARPRNAFIIFRCEYSQIHSRHGRRVRRIPGTATEPTLSKRAALAWSQLSCEEKRPYKIRAEEERSEHARKYPDYRFRPQRRPGANGKRFASHISISGDLQRIYPSPESSPEPLRNVSANVISHIPPAPVNQSPFTLEFANSSNCKTLTEQPASFGYKGHVHAIHSAPQECSPAHCSTGLLTPTSPHLKTGILDGVPMSSISPSAAASSIAPDCDDEKPILSMAVAEVARPNSSNHQNSIFPGSYSEYPTSHVTFFQQTNIDAWPSNMLQYSLSEQEITHDQLGMTSLEIPHYDPTSILPISRFTTLRDANLFAEGATFSNVNHSPALQIH